MILLWYENQQQQKKDGETKIRKKWIDDFTVLAVIDHRCFSGSVNSWAPSMGNGFQFAKFLFEVQKASSLFCCVQNGPVVIWVACIGLRGSSKLS